MMSPARVAEGYGELGPVMPVTSIVRPVLSIEFKLGSLSGEGAKASFRGGILARLMSEYGSGDAATHIAAFLEVNMVQNVVQNACCCPALHRLSTTVGLECDKSHWTFHPYLARLLDFLLYETTKGVRDGDGCRPPYRGRSIDPCRGPQIAGDTSAIVGFNILITDVNGTVIGSGDVSRVGSFHEASLDVISTHAPATPSAAQARMLQGVVPGVTLPILLNGQAVGAVGITGSPKQVTRLG